MSIIRLRDMMVACYHIDILLNYPGCKQIIDEDIQPLICNNTKDNTLVVIGMDRDLLQDIRQTIISFVKHCPPKDYMIYDNNIVLGNKLRIRFINIQSPEAIYGLQPDYVYII